MSAFEVEIKSLLGSREAADALVSRMKLKEPNLKEVGTHKQLNHYFEGGDLAALSEKISAHLSADKAAAFKELAQKTKDFSMRTRWADGKVIFVFKASISDQTSSNGIARMEFESPVDLTIEGLDQILLNSGFKYQAKWSRERTEYEYQGVNVTIDKNAGYGYLAEFEIVEDDAGKANSAQAKLRLIMDSLNVQELNQDRLARMFAFYNKNWQDYYGTDKVFDIE